MQLQAARAVDVAVGDVEDPLAKEPHHLVVDLEVEANEAQRFGPIEEFQHTVLVQFGGAGQQAEGDPFAEGRRVLEQGTLLLVERRDLLLDDLFQRVREIAFLQRLDHPLLTDQADLSVVHQLADDFAQE